MLKDRPLIGINTDVRATAKGRPAHAVLQCGYLDCILAAGGLPILIPPLVKECELLSLVERLDGLVLSEGDDLDPKKQGLGFHPSIKQTSERRENTDRALCKIAQQRKIPLLGIGLGMQEMTVCYGGGLYQHLPEDLPKSIPHYDPQGGAHRHIVVMAKGSIMEDIYGEGEIRVNSYHHQGLRKLPTGFRAGAHAPDGLVEAIEWTGEDWFAIGVQWHPQNEGQISLDMQLIEAFISAAAKANHSARPAAKLPLAKAG